MFTVEGDGFRNGAEGAEHMAYHVTYGTWRMRLFGFFEKERCDRGNRVLCLQGKGGLKQGVV
jgi:hypothetical protein